MIGEVARGVVWRAVGRPSVRLRASADKIRASATLSSAATRLSSAAHCTSRTSTVAPAPHNDDAVRHWKDIGKKVAEIGMTI